MLVLIRWITPVELMLVACSQGGTVQFEQTFIHPLVDLVV